MNKNEEKNPKFKINDLVVFDGMLGLITEISIDKVNMLYLYKVGHHSSLIAECCLQKADWRDEIKILGKRNNSLK